MSNMSGLAGQLESLGPSVGLQEVLAGRLSREDYTARFGHRGVNEVELAWPRPAEDPGWLDAALAAAAAGSDVAVLRTRQASVFDEAISRLRKADSTTRGEARDVACGRRPGRLPRARLPAPRACAPPG